MSSYNHSIYKGLYLRCKIDAATVEKAYVGGYLTLAERDDILAQDVSHCNVTPTA